MKDVLKSVIVWAMIIPIAILNGGLREEILIHQFGEAIAQPVSSVLLCLFIFLLTLFALPKFAKRNYLAIGILWFMLTVIFEFGIGYASNLTFSEMLNAYDITTGNLWSFIVIFTGIAPWIGANIHKMFFSH